MLEKSRYSYDHLCRLFRAEYGIPPLKYVRGLRIDRAKLLLNDTILSVSEIAYRVGFSEAGVLLRVVQKNYRKPPSEYRKTSVLCLPPTFINRGSDTSGA